MNKKIKLIIGITILCLLIYKIGIIDIFNTIKNLNPIYLIPILITYVISIIQNGLNIKILATPYKKIKLKSSIIYHLQSYTMGLVTPGNIGEIYLAKALEKENLPLSKGIVIYSIDKVITLSIFAITTIIGGLFIFQEFIPKESIIISILILIIIATIIKRYSKKILKKILKKYSAKIDEVYSLIRQYIKKEKKAILFNTINTTIKWIIISIGIKLLIQGFGYSIPTLVVFTIMLTSRLISIIPITISGIGIKEGVAVLLFTQFSIPPEAIISTYLIYSGINYAIGSAIAIKFMAKTKRINST